MGPEARVPQFSLPTRAAQRLSHPSDVSAGDIISTLNHMALPTFVDLVLVRRRR